MGVTPKQAWAIAHLVAELRPEWQAEGVVSAIKKCADRNPALVALAAIRASVDPDAKTPGVIPTQGTHWQDGIKEAPATTKRNPTPAEACATCGRREHEHAHRWLDDHPFIPLDQATRGRAPADQHLARVRAEVRPTVTFETETAQEGNHE